MNESGFPPETRGNEGVSEVRIDGVNEVREAGVAAPRPRPRIDLDSFPMAAEPADVTPMSPPFCPPPRPTAPPLPLVGGVTGDRDIEGKTEEKEEPGETCVLELREELREESVEGEIVGRGGKEVEGVDTTS